MWRQWVWRLSAGIAVLLVAGTGYAQWRPNRNVEIVVPFPAGGGNDVPARLMQKILTDEKLLGSSSTVVNKPGAGGTLGLLYVNQQKGDAHYLSLISTTTLTAHITGTGKVNYTDLSPITPIVKEAIAFAVHPNSAIKSMKDLIDQMKKDPSSLSFAVGGGLGNPNHVAIAAALKMGGIEIGKMKAVAFGGGKEALTAVLGEHVNVLAAAASIIAAQLQTGQLRALGIAAPHRLVGPLGKYPTLREQGVALDFGFSRYIVGPAGVSGDGVAFWSQTLAKMMATPEWRAQVLKNNWESEFLPFDKTVADLAAQYQLLRGTLTDLGMAR